MDSVMDQHPGWTRRLMLKSALVGALVCSFGATGLRHARAAAEAALWPEQAFKQKSEVDAVKTLYGKTAEPSDKVKLDAPEIAENGAVVPISVASALPNTTSISILVLENPYTLAASYQIPEGTAASVSNRLKMAKTSNVIALVEAGGKLYSASKEVKVTVGGCGG
jgi:sulfur-oxidizing protein SoxY